MFWPCLSPPPLLRFVFFLIVFGALICSLHLFGNNSCLPARQVKNTNQRIQKFFCKRAVICGLLSPETSSRSSYRFKAAILFLAEAVNSSLSLMLIRVPFLFTLGLYLACLAVCLSLLLRNFIFVKVNDEMKY